MRKRHLTVPPAPKWSAPKRGLTHSLCCFEGRECCRCNLICEEDAEGVRGGCRARRHRVHGARKAQDGDCAGRGEHPQEARQAHLRLLDAVRSCRGGLFGWIEHTVDLFCSSFAFWSFWFSCALSRFPPFLLSLLRSVRVRDSLAVLFALVWRIKTLSRTQHKQPRWPRSPPLPRRLPPRRRSRTASRSAAGRRTSAAA